MFKYIPEYSNLKPIEEIIKGASGKVILREQKWKVQYEKRKYAFLKNSGGRESVLFPSWEEYREEKYNKQMVKDWNKKHFLRIAWCWLWSLDYEHFDNQHDKWVRQIIRSSNNKG